jgi:putative colanic acid biosynthesis UDP-glucose lipid carrier transferase
MHLTLQPNAVARIPGLQNATTGRTRMSHSEAEARALVHYESKPRALHVVHAPGDYRFRLAATPLGSGAKRAFDVLVCFAALVPLAPLLLITALWVKLDSPGPALFKQRRGGFRGRTFYVLKFRTMRVMEGGASVRQAVRGDTRVTRLGRFLRKTSLDELPQLLNVLRGDMSLVGPRPHALSHDKAFWDVNGAYPKRFLARPGLTGWAQVNGARGESETEEKMEKRLRYDIEYVENWSLGADIRILARTVKLVVADANAY